MRNICYYSEINEKNSKKFLKKLINSHYKYNYVLMVAQNYSYVYYCNSNVNYYYYKSRNRTKALILQIIPLSVRKILLLKI